MVKAAYVDKNGLKRGAWSEEEDNKLRAYITKYKAWNWRQLPKFAGLARCGKSCRLRWENYLKPDLKRGNFKKEDEELIMTLHQKHGNKWSLIAKSMPGRTDNEIKNFWHTKLSKRTKPTNVWIESLDQLQALAQNKKPSVAIAGSDLSTQNREEDTNFFDCLSPISSPSIVSTLSELDSIPRSFGNFGNEPVSYDYPNSPEEALPISFQSFETKDMLVDSSKDEVLPTIREDFHPPSGIEWTAEDCIDFVMSPLVDNQNSMGTYAQMFPVVDSSNTKFLEDTFFETFENLSLDASDTEILPSSFSNPMLVTDEFKNPEQNFFDTFKNFPMEPFPIDTSNTDIIPFSAYNPTLVADKFKNHEETFGSCPTESFSIDASNSQIYSPGSKNIFPSATEVFPSFDNLRLQSHRDTMESLFDPFPIFGNDHFFSDPSNAKKLASTSCFTAMETQEYGTPDGNYCATSGTRFTEPFLLDAFKSNIWPSSMFDASTLLGHLDSQESFGFWKALWGFLQ